MRLPSRFHAAAALIATGLAWPAIAQAQPHPDDRTPPPMHGGTMPDGPTHPGPMHPGPMHSGPMHPGPMMAPDMPPPPPPPPGWHGPDGPRGYHEDHRAWLERCAGGPDHPHRRDPGCAGYPPPYPPNGYGYGYGYPGGYPGYGYMTYGVPMILVPVLRSKPCPQTVEEEWIEEPVRVRRRAIPPRRAVPDKRVRIAPVPDKRVRVAPAPEKRVPAAPAKRIPY